MLKQLDQSIRTLNQYIDQQWLTVKKSVIHSFKHLQSLSKQVPAQVKESHKINSRTSNETKQALQPRVPLNQLKETDDAYLLLDGLLVTKEQLQLLKKQLPDICLLYTSPSPRD